MNTLIDAAKAAVSQPEVMAMIEKLSEYGLGVCVPHIHSTNGEMAPLPDDVVQVEQGLRVSFINRGHFEATDALPVAWRWDAKAKMPSACALCSNHPDDGDYQSTDD